MLLPPAAGWLHTVRSLLVLGGVGIPLSPFIRDDSGNGTSYLKKTLVVNLVPHVTIAPLTFSSPKVLFPLQTCPTAARGGWRTWCSSRLSRESPYSCSPVSYRSKCGNKVRFFTSVMWLVETYLWQARKVHGVRVHALRRCTNPLHLVQGI